ncbi:MAG: MltA domain-containing protein [Nitratireductor sp.]|nr:MltA domain-containing protein [Nitratireductor sp.]MCB1457173.1 MltA domain-containing protein [Nitratireductor sp.]
MEAREPEKQAGSGPTPANPGFRRVSFTDLAGWQEDDHLAALHCFAVSARHMQNHPHSTKALGTDTLLLQAAGLKALHLLASPDSDRKTARQFFETEFVPVRAGSGTAPGFVTGYFEPEIEASPVRTGRFSWPLLRRPDDLVDLDRDPHDSQAAVALPPELRFARKTGDGLVEYWDRRQIESGALSGRGLELAWIESPVDAFFIHVQGSARLVMPDGGAVRISYAGKSGQTYTSIGKVLADDGILPRETITMQVLRQWLLDNRDAGRELMWRNRSYIFFGETAANESATGAATGPVAAAGVPLTPGRSLAIDHRLHSFSTPVWLSLAEPVPGLGDSATGRFQRLMIAQDTGSAIIGPARGDIFTGSGHAAGEAAGIVKHRTDFVYLVPEKQDRIQAGMS